MRKRSSSRSLREGRRRTDLAGILVVAVLRTACASRRPPDAVGPPAPAGIVNYSLFRDPNAGVVHLEPNQDFWSPSLISDKPLPTYPDDLLPQQLPPQEAVVRIFIGESGEILAVIPGPTGGAAAGPYHSMFVEAAQAAVRQWRFTPARLRSFGPGEDVDGDGRPDSQVLTGDTPTKVFLDFKFVFEIREGKGIVKQVTGSGQSSPP
jgi:hypothetical protein